MTESLGPSNDHIPADEAIKAIALARTALDNQRFQDATEEERRVILAKDVLAWLRAKKIAPLAGVYLDNIRNSDNDETVDGGTCTACALGAMVVCALERRAGLGLPTGGVIPTVMATHAMAPRRTIMAALDPYFGRLQLDNIESAFERRYIGGGGTPAVLFGSRYTEDGARMKAIMKNIIANKGTFVP